MKKIVSYLGFAIKSKNLIAGQSQIKYCNKQLHLIMVCNSASDNLKNLAYNVSKRHNCEVIITKQSLPELTNINDIKIIGLTDESLSKAIIENKESISID